MEGEVPERAVAARMAKRQMLRRDAGNEPAGGVQDAIETPRQLGHRHGRAVREDDAEERGHAARVPPVDGALGGHHGRDRRDPEALQLLPRFRVRLDVDGVKRESPCREQLSRLGAGASAGAVVEDRLLIAHLSVSLGDGSSRSPSLA